MKAQTTGTATKGTATGRKIVKLKPKASGGTFKKWEKHGDEIAGIVVDKATETSKWGDGDRTVVTFEQADGNFIRVDFHPAGLRDYVDDIEVSRWYSIRYVDDKPTKSGSMRCFEVEADESEMPEPEDTAPQQDVSF